LAKNVLEGNTDSKFIGPASYFLMNHQLVTDSQPSSLQPISICRHCGSRKVYSFDPCEICRGSCFNSEQVDTMQPPKSGDNSKTLSLAAWSRAKSSLP